MGWSNGAGLMAEIIEIVEEHFPPITGKEELYYHMIKSFSDTDCDNLDECLGQSPSFDDALSKYHSHFSDWDD
jgi:hypothetical protein